MRSKLLPILLAAGLSSLYVCTAFTRSSSAVTDLNFLRSFILRASQADQNRRFKLQLDEVAALFLSFVVAALANACGVGGGAFFVPMFNVLLGFSLKGSTALSQAVVTGGALASFMYSSFKRHPDDHKMSLIDFDLALILTPMLLLGITAGVLLNAVMPDWLITVLLVLVLSWLTIKTFWKGLELHSSEVAAQQQGQQEDAQQDQAVHVRHEISVTRHNSSSEDIHAHESFAAAKAHNPVKRKDDPVLDSITELDVENGQITADRDGAAASHRQPAHLSLWVSWRVVQFGELLCLWAGFLGLQYGKVSFSQCSWQYALLCSCQSVFSLLMTGLFIVQARGLRLNSMSDLQDPLIEERKSVVSHHDWSMFMLLKCVVVVLMGGMVAGMLGFGGGMVLNPLMLEMGINPLVSSATSSLMVLFSASAATFSFAVSGKLNYQYGFAYGGLCAAASIVGVSVISTSVRRSGKGSRIVFTLAFIVATGAVMQAIFGGSAAVHDVRTGQHLSFESFC